MATDKSYSLYHITIAFEKTPVAEKDLEKVINRLKKRISTFVSKKGFKGIALIGASVDNGKLGKMTTNNAGHKTFIPSYANYEKTQPHVHIGILGYGASEIGRFICEKCKSKYGIAIAWMDKYDSQLKLADYVVTQSFLIRTVIFDVDLNKVSTFIQTANFLDKKTAPRQVVFDKIVKELDATLLMTDEEILRALTEAKYPKVDLDTENDDDLPFGPDCKMIAKSAPVTEDEELPFGPNSKMIAKAEPAIDDEDLPFDPDDTTSGTNPPAYTPCGLFSLFNALNNRSDETDFFEQQSLFSLK